MTICGVEVPKLQQKIAYLFKFPQSCTSLESHKDKTLFLYQNEKLLINIYFFKKRFLSPRKLSLWSTKPTIVLRKHTTYHLTSETWEWSESFNRKGVMAVNESTDVFTLNHYATIETFSVPYIFPFSKKYPQPWKFSIKPKKMLPITHGAPPYI